MSESTPKPTYSMDPTLWLYTSLTSGSSHIVTATSRMETILKANRIPFKALDIATDEKARMLWGRRAGKDESGRQRKIPGLVQEGFVVGDLVEVEDWNEYGELKQHVKIVPVAGQKQPPVLSTSKAPTKAPVPGTQENKKLEDAAPDTSKQVDSTKSAATPITLALRQVGQEAAQKAKDNKKKASETTYDGVGEAEPMKEDLANSVVVPPPIKTGDSGIDHQVESVASLQSPNSTAWKDAKATTPRQSIERIASLQSPTTTTDDPVSTHRGSTVSIVSAEEIKQIEEDAAVKEED